MASFDFGIGDWLDELERSRADGVAPIGTGSGPVRVYAGPELSRLDADCRGFMLYLEQQGVLDRLFGMFGRRPRGSER